MANNLEYSLQLKLDKVNASLSGLQNLIDKIKPVITPNLNTTLFENKLGLIKNQISGIANQRVELNIKADTIEAKIKKVDSDLIKLKAQASSPELDLKIAIAEAKLAKFQNDLGKTKNGQIALDINENGLNAKLRQVQNQGEATGIDTGKKFTSGFNAGTSNFQSIVNTTIGNVLANATTAVAGAVSGQVKKAFGTSIDFSAQLSSIQALTGITSGELKKVELAALASGKATKFSALESAQGIESLLKAGISLETVLNGGGLTGALNLAAAGEIAVGEAADIASTALNTFSKDGINVSRAADILAGAANVSATDVASLKLSLSAVGPVAALAGQSFKDTSTALALFANNGLKGSDAGTSLKTLLNNLVPTTKPAIEAFNRLGLATNEVRNNFLNADGSFKSLSEISGELQKATNGLSESQKSLALETIFGSDAIRAGAILSKEGAIGFDKLSTAIDKISAAEVAKKRLDNVKGSLEALNGTVETAQILLLSGFEPTLQRIIKATERFINAIDFAAVGDQLSKFGDIILAIDFQKLGADAGNAYNELIKYQPLIDGLVAGIEGLIAISAITAVIGLLAGAFALLTSPIVLVSAGIGLLVSQKDNLKLLSPFIDLIKVGFDNLFNAFDGGNIIIASFSKVFELISGAVQIFLPFLIGIIAQVAFFGVQVGVFVSQLITQLYPVVLQIIEAFGNFATAISPLVKGVVIFAGIIINVLLAAFNLVFPIIGGIVIAFAVAVGQQITNIINIFTGIINFFTGVFSGDWELAFKGLKQVVQGLIDFIGGIFNLIVSPFKGAFEGILNLFTAFDLAKKGLDWVNGFIDSVKSKIGEVVDIVKNTLSNIKLPELKFPEIKLPELPKFGSNANGTDFWTGGITELAERGRELFQLPSGAFGMASTRGFMNLPRGTKIFDNRKTEGILAQPTNFGNYQSQTDQSKSSYDNRNYRTNKTYNYQTANNGFSPSKGDLGYAD